MNQSTILKDHLFKVLPLKLETNDSEDITLIYLQSLNHSISSPKLTAHNSRQTMSQSTMPLLTLMKETKIKNTVQLTVILYFKVFGASRDRFITVLQRHKLPPASYNPKAIKQPISSHL
jgi:hypothetical protein